VLLGIFIYWAGTPESPSTRSLRRRPTVRAGAAVVSTLLLVVTYVAVAAAAQVYGGTHFLARTRTTC
jgi:hypothetical protein